MKGKRRGPQQCYRTRRPGAVCDRRGGSDHDGFLDGTGGEATLTRVGTFSFEKFCLWPLNDQKLN